ncbi:MAG: polysaccharide biosynthesis protein [Bacteroidales bacterium]|nr:polysaccharide biosynthesis protein [Bacteroidales bacterium]
MRRLASKIMFAVVRRYRHATISQWTIIAIDTLIFFAVFFLSLSFRPGGIEELVRQTGYRAILCKLLFSLVATLLAFFFTGSYRGIIRHTGMSDIYRILLACALPALLLFGCNFLNNQLKPPLITPLYLPSYRETISTFTLLAVFMIALRLMLQRIYNDYFRRHRPTTNVLIYGAGAVGIITYNALNQDANTEYKVEAFIDDDTSKINQSLNGIPVMQASAVLNQHFVKKKDIRQLIIAVPTMRMRHKQAITNRALDLGLGVKSVPRVSTWINGSFTSTQIQDIRIEDLLGRDPILTDKTQVERSVKGKVVLVTGAAGSIGSEICRQLMQFEASKVVMLDQAESPMYDLQYELLAAHPSLHDRMEFVIANVKDPARMEEVFARFRPQLVYHAAAYKHVPFMEENPYEAVYVNVFGTRNLADLALRYGVERFVMISTDKAVNPTNVMGATKRMAEIYIQSRSTEQTHFITTRFGNVLGSNGSVIPLFKKQLEAGGPLTITHKEIIRYFMTIPEACSLVLEASAMGEGGDIFVFDMGKPVRIYDLARRMIQLSGLSNIEIKEIGLRPGEKLYEELLATKENTIPTPHPKIMRAKVRTYPIDQIDRAYDELWTMLATMDDMAIVGKMKAIVPEFRSNNSIYCQLDKGEA